MKANTVNMRLKSYHHGDLRAALIGSGLRMLALREGDDLSLREIARSVGVSATAVYGHFPDKAALMRELAAEGLRRLANAQREASYEAGGGAAGFEATGRAYVRFALANPALFRVIFSNPAHPALLAEPSGDIPDAMAFLRANAAAVAGDGDASMIALRAWSLAHGVAMLMLDNQIAHSEEVVQSIFASELRR